MKNWLLISSSLAAIGSAALWISHASGQSAAPPRATRSPARIAVVDLNRVFEHYRKSADLKEEAQAALDASNAKIKRLQGEHLELAKSLKDGEIEVDSDEFRSTQAKLFQIESYAQVYQKTANRQLKSEEIKGVYNVYLDIQQALKVFSDQNGFTNVIRVDKKARTLKEPQDASRILGQDIVYFREADDITNAVVVYLNGQYERTAGKKEATSSPDTSSKSNPPPGTKPATKTADRKPAPSR